MNGNGKVIADYAYTPNTDIVNENDYRTLNDFLLLNNYSDKKKRQLVCTTAASSTLNSWNKARPHDYQNSG
jgi:hypothetical protein